MWWDGSSGSLTVAKCMEEVAGELHEAEKILFYLELSILRLELISMQTGKGQDRESG